MAWYRCISTMDRTGRFHTLLTPVILVILAIVVAVLQTHLTAHCVSSELTDGQLKSIESSCAKDTHFIHASGTEKEGERALATFQYFAFVLLGLAVLFYVSGALWRLFVNGCSELPLRNIYLMAKQAKKTKDPSSYKHAVENLAGHIYSATVESGCNRVLLTFVRALQNLIFALHAVIQMLALSKLATGGTFFTCGIQWLLDYRYNEATPTLALFPRSVICNNGTSVGQEMECVLGINVFQEKVVIFLWFWFLFLALAALVSLVGSLASLTCSACPINPDGKFVSRYLHARRLADSRKAAQRFTKELLGPDGVLALRGISKYGGDLVATDVMEALWNGAQPECVSPVVPRRAGGEDRDSNAETVQLTSVRYDDVDPYAADDLNLNMQKPLLYESKRASGGGTATRPENSYAV